MPHFLHTLLLQMPRDKSQIAQKEMRIIVQIAQIEATG
jgi:hypothetical protein